MREYISLIYTAAAATIVVKMRPVQGHTRYSVHQVTSLYTAPVIINLIKKSRAKKKNKRARQSQTRRPRGEYLDRASYTVAGANENSRGAIVAPSRTTIYIHSSIFAPPSSSSTRESWQKVSPSLKCDSNKRRASIPRLYIFS